MQKLDFHIEGLRSEQADGIKAGDVLLVKKLTVEQPQAGHQPQLACYKPASAQDGGDLQLGQVPVDIARKLAAHGELQASVRSIKRSQDGQLQDLLLRVQITTAGNPAVLAPAKPAAAGDVKPEYILDDQGYQLRRKQLEQLVHNPELIQQLGDERLQTLIKSIDSSSHREQALKMAMEQPAFAQFSNQALLQTDEEHRTSV